MKNQIAITTRLALSALQRFDPRVRLAIVEEEAVRYYVGASHLNLDVTIFATGEVELWGPEVNLAGLSTVVAYLKKEFA